MRRFFCLRGVFLIVLPYAVSGQNTPTLEVQRPATVQPSGRERQITLEVQVTARSGAPIRGLQKEDFTLLDDKQPQKILSFQAVDSGAAMAADPPVEIILVVDAVNTSFMSNSYERDAVRNFLLQNGGKLAWPVSFIFVSEGGPQILNRSSRDGNALVGFWGRPVGDRAFSANPGDCEGTELTKRCEMLLRRYLKQLVPEGRLPKDIVSSMAKAC